MMPSLLLDTTVLIDALRGGSAVDRLRRLRHDRVPLVTTPINVEEIVRGLRPSEVDVATVLFAGLHVLPLRRPEGERAGSWRRDYAGRGITLHQADCLIAACAMSVGARLATANTKDFPMPELDVEHWPIGR